jgi:hypothetical protein
MIDSCEAGYYCTSDNAGITYCCLDGIDTAECARQYSITGSLIRDATSTTAAEVIEPASSTEGVPTVTEIVSLPVASVDTPTLSASVTLPSVSAGNGSFSTPSLPEFTGGAVKGRRISVALLAGAAGLVFL